MNAVRPVRRQGKRSQAASCLMIRVFLQAISYAHQKDFVMDLKTRAKLTKAALRLFAKYPAQLKAFLALLEHANSKTGEAYPSYETICDLAKCSLATVSTMIKVAEEAGMLLVRRSKAWRWVKGVRRFVSAVNRYRFRLPQGLLDASEIRRKLHHCQAQACSASGRTLGPQITAFARRSSAVFKPSKLVPLCSLKSDSGGKSLDASLAKFERLFSAKEQFN